MQMLNEKEIKQIAGAGCNWHDFGQDVLKGGICGGIGGAVTGGSVSLGTLAIPGWAAGAALGGIGGGAAYGATCWW